LQMESEVGEERRTSKYVIGEDISKNKTGEGKVASWVFLDRAAASLCRALPTGAKGKTRIIGNRVASPREESLNQRNRSTLNP